MVTMALFINPVNVFNTLPLVNYKHPAFSEDTHVVL